jgi:hypothetical protein
VALFLLDCIRSDPEFFRSFDDASAYTHAGITFDEMDVEKREYWESRAAETLDQEARTLDGALARAGAELASSSSSSSSSGAPPASGSSSSSSSSSSARPDAAAPATRKRKAASVPPPVRAEAVDEPPLEEMRRLVDTSYIGHDGRVFWQESAKVSAYVAETFLVETGTKGRRRQRQCDKSCRFMCATAMQVAKHKHLRSDGVVNHKTCLLAMWNTRQSMIEALRTRKETGEWPE